MSLLMDALKRAEEAKRQRGEEAVPATGGLQLEAVSPTPEDNRNSPLPDLDSHLDSVEAELKAAAEQPGRQSPPHPDYSAGRTVAKNVLAASASGKAAVSPTAPPTPNGMRLVAIIGAGVIAVGAVGGYYYWQLQSLSQNSNRLAAPGLANAGARPPAPITAMPAPSPAAPATPPPAATTIQPRIADSSAAIVATPKEAIPEAVATAPAPAEKIASSSVKTPSVAATKKPKPSSPAPLASAIPSPPAAEAPASTSKSIGSDSVQVSARSQEAPAVRAYNALLAGNFAEAKAGYMQAVRENPRDVDALLGMATLARREGDAATATELYERVLRQDPRNANAVTGLLALQGGTDAVQAESRLKTLAGMIQGESQRTQLPDNDASAAVHFALGNLYAGQRRWAEAQQSYFKAHTADAGNPDTLYNLAISLEHLNQLPLARQFYQQAIQASRQRSAVFDRSEAEKRLAALTR